MPPKTYSAADAAKELGLSVLYIHRVLRAAGIEKTHGIYMIDEPTMKRLRAMRAAAPAKAAKKRGAA
jgi:hypothetical protein